ncbi:MAG: hypothetical protein IJX98_03735 [Clostridia bacterium]|nr:hypothetical protein [Clostridia bacterium]
MLLSVQALYGALWLLFFFAFCFFAVHCVRYFAKPKQKSKQQPDQTPPPKAQETPSPQPVYYIVEKKSKRPKAKYSDPKQIHFQ